MIDRDGADLRFREVDADYTMSLNRRNSNRIVMADLVESSSPVCAQIIRQSNGVRRNLLRSFADKSKLLKLKEFYKGNEKIYNQLTNLAKKEKIAIEELNDIFKEFQAHHIIPVNLIKESDNLQIILEYAKKTGFDFNSADNSIFLHVDNHFGSHSKYDKMIEGIIGEIDIDDLDKAVAMFILI